MAGRSASELGGLPATIVEAWVEAERPNPVVLAVLAGASVFLAAPLLVAYQQAADLVPGAHDVLEVLASPDARGLLSEDPVALGSGLASVIAAALVVRWIARWARDRLGTPPILRALRDRPTSMVWAYPTRVEQVWANGSTEKVTGQRHTLSIGFADGSIFHDLPVRDPDVAMVLAALRALSPGLVVGYTDELRQRFRRSPRTFAAEGSSPGPARV